MDKRRSEGSSIERSRTNSQTISRENAAVTNLKQPKRIGNNDAFLDASRDPRLNNVKYRAQMMTNKSRVSPDTTVRYVLLSLLFCNLLYEGYFTYLSIYKYFFIDAHRCTVVHFSPNI